MDSRVGIVTSYALMTIGPDSPRRRRSRARACSFSLAALSIGIFLTASLAASTGIGKGLLSAVHYVPGGDAAGHFLLAGIPAFLLVIACHCSRSRVSQARLVALTVGGLAVLLTIDEFLQIFFTRRSFSITDLVANYAGIAVFSLIGFVITRRLRQSHEDDA